MRQVDFTHEIPHTDGLLAGVDEAGRGPLAGPVVAAAVILPDNHDIVGLADSKKLGAEQRAKLAKMIREQSICWCVGAATPMEIDALNIHHATLLAMRRGVLGLACQPTLVLADGKFEPAVDCQVRAVIKGDSRVEVISAASIVAKEWRDEYMRRLHQVYPEFGFDQHKGYPTRAHQQALQRHGASPVHRFSYAPVSQVAGQ